MLPPSQCGVLWEAVEAQMAASSARLAAARATPQFADSHQRDRDAPLGPALGCLSSRMSAFCWLAGRPQREIPARDAPQRPRRLPPPLPASRVSSLRPRAEPQREPGQIAATNLSSVAQNRSVGVAGRLRDRIQLSRAASLPERSEASASNDESRAVRPPSGTGYAVASTGSMGIPESLEQLGNSARALAHGAATLPFAYHANRNRRDAPDNANVATQAASPAVGRVLPARRGGVTMSDGRQLVSRIPSGRASGARGPHRQQLPPPTGMPANGMTLPYVRSRVAQQ